MQLEERRIDRYLAATGGSQIEPLVRGGVLTPAYSATWETAMALHLLAAAGEGIPRAGLIHLESEMVQIRCLGREELISTRMELEGTEQTSGGTVFTIRSRNWNGSGQLCTDGSTKLLLRDRSVGRAGGLARGGRTSRDDSWHELTRWKLTGGHGRRYARASGDYNPIHLWAVTSRPLGFSRPILQGFCLQALVAHALIQCWMRGEPSGLRRLRIAFKAPLPLPSEPRMMVDAQVGTSAARFQVIDGLNQEKVFAEGDFVGA
ncbi:hypothetical protein BH23GEM6_BH23GEM6_03300 [soil metagenome]